MAAANPDKSDETTNGASSPSPATSPAITGPMIIPMLLALESRASVLMRNRATVWSAA